MSFINVVMYNIKRMLKTKMTLLMTFAMPIVIVLGLGLYFNGMSIDDSKVYYIVNLDASSEKYAEELVNVLDNKYNIEILLQEEAVEKLKNKRISEYYEIPSDFSSSIIEQKKPEIIVNRRESNLSFNNFNMELNDVINKMMVRDELEEGLNVKITLEQLTYNDTIIKVNAKESDFISQITLSLLISFLLYSSIGLTYELFYLKKQGTLRRSLATGNSTGKVIGAILLAQFLLLAVGYSLISIMNIFVNAPSMKVDIPIIIFNICALSLVGLSLAVLVNRLVKNEGLIAIVLQVIIGLTCFVGGTFVPIDMLPEKITHISKFTPQFWAMESIATGRWEYTIVVLLFAFVLFTAGTLSSKSFVEIG